VIRSSVCQRSQLRTNGTNFYSDRAGGSNMILAVTALRLFQLCGPQIFGSPANHIISVVSVYLSVRRYNFRQP